MAIKDNNILSEGGTPNKDISKDTNLLDDGLGTVKLGDPPSPTGNTGIIKNPDIIINPGDIGSTGKLGDPPSPTGNTGRTGSTSGDLPASIKPEEWTTPSWEKDSAEQAKNQLLQDISTVEQSQLKSRTSIESNANQANQEYTMLSYQQNQNIEKMGWGGGSYHDAKMQEEYLKASIQADMYGQLELQKYGYETEMAKARAAYDSNQKQLAMEYMKIEYERAYNNAQMTGVWIDPTVKDRLAAWDIANKELEANKGDPSSQAYKKAKSTRDQILASFNIDTSLTEQGVDVLRQILEQQQLYSKDTYTMAQLESLKLETDNAAELASREITKQDEEKGIYSYTNEAGEKVQVNIFGTDYEAIKALMNETNNQNLVYEVIGKYRSSFKAGYDSWLQQKREANPDDKTTYSLLDYIREHPGLYAEEFNKALSFAKGVGMEQFYFFNNVGETGVFNTASTKPIPPGGGGGGGGGGDYTYPTEDEARANPAIVGNITPPFADEPYTLAYITQKYKNFYDKLPGDQSIGTSESIAAQYVKDMQAISDLMTNTKGVKDKTELTHLFIKIAELKDDARANEAMSGVTTARIQSITGLPIISTEFSTQTEDLELVVSQDALKDGDDELTSLGFKKIYDTNKSNTTTYLYDNKASKNNDREFEGGSGWNVGSYEYIQLFSELFFNLYKQ